MNEKISNLIISLRRYFNEKKSVLVLFSGGVDSSVLAKVAKDSLKKNAYALTIVQEFYPMYNLDIARKIAKKIGITHIITYANFLNDYNVRKNDNMRCYFCKKIVVKIAKAFASRLNINTIVEGTNVDDLKEDRPGLKALEESGVESPYLKLGIGKSDIRMIAKELGLENYDLPKNSCYATRIVGDFISEEKLKIVDDIESFLFNKGVKCIRARIHSDTIILETSERFMNRIVDLSHELINFTNKYKIRNVFLNLKPRSED